MRKRNKVLSLRWREKRPLRDAIGTKCGFAATVLFALYNGGLGIYYVSPWHGSICIYYMLMSLVRGILLSEKRKTGGEGEEGCRRKVFVMVSVIVLLMNAALALPVSLMVLDRRPVRTGMIPAITSAAYTTYKISAASVRMKRANGSVPDRQLSMIRLVDALVSVLVLQNTLIVAVDGGISPRLFYLTAISSAGIFLLILAVSVTCLARGILYDKKS